MAQLLVVLSISTLEYIKLPDHVRKIAEARKLSAGTRDATWRHESTLSTYDCAQLTDGNLTLTPSSGKVEQSEVPGTGRYRYKIRQFAQTDIASLSFPRTNISQGCSGSPPPSGLESVRSLSGS